MPYWTTLSPTPGSAPHTHHASRRMPIMNHRPRARAPFGDPVRGLPSTHHMHLRVSPPHSLRLPCDRCWIRCGTSGRRPIRRARRGRRPGRHPWRVTPAERTQAQAQARPRARPGLRRRAQRSGKQGRKSAQHSGRAAVEGEMERAAGGRQSTAGARIPLHAEHCKGAKALRRKGPGTNGRTGKRSLRKAY